jgi:hypothetical protein
MDFFMPFKITADRGGGQASGGINDEHLSISLSSKFTEGVEEC